MTLVVSILSILKQPALTMIRSAKQLLNILIKPVLILLIMLSHQPTPSIRNQRQRPILHPTQITANLAKLMMRLNIKPMMPLMLQRWLQSKSLIALVTPSVRQWLISQPSYQKRLMILLKWQIWILITK